jgi:predicted RNA-binding protein with PUA-like domain
VKYWLAKSDPETYSIDDLERDGTTEWDGVRHPVAVKHLKAMQAGDKVLIYHSQGQGAIVGLAEVAGDSKPDPNDEKSWLVNFKFLKKFPEPYITLKDIKATGQFDDWELVRISRLSTIPVPERFVEYLKTSNLSV